MQQLGIGTGYGSIVRSVDEQRGYRNAPAAALKVEAAAVALKVLYNLEIHRQSLPCTRVEHVGHASALPIVPVLSGTAHIAQSTEGCKPLHAAILAGFHDGSRPASAVAQKEEPTSVDGCFGEEVTIGQRIEHLAEIVLLVAEIVATESFRVGMVGGAFQGCSAKREIEADESEAMPRKLIAHLRPMTPVFEALINLTAIYL